MKINQKLLSTGNLTLYNCLHFFDSQVIVFSFTPSKWSKYESFVFVYIDSVDFSDVIQFSQNSPTEREFNSFC